MSQHQGKKFTRDEWVVDKAFKSPFFGNLEEIGGAYEIRQLKQIVMAKRPHHCGAVVCELVKLQMLEFYCDFLGKYLNWQDFELCYLDTDSFYL